MTQILYLADSLLSAFIAIWLCICCAGDGKRGKVVEHWQAAGRSLEIRAIVYEETGVYLSGTFYDFDARRVGSDQWTRVMSFRHDDRPSIPHDVHFVDDRTTYFFMGWMYAVTIDGGRTWSVWDASKDLPSWQCCNYGLIARVDLQADGIGTMTLRPIEGRRGEVPALITSDFGQHWTAR